MKPCVSPFSTARDDSGHGALADQRSPAGLADFGLGHAGAAERRVDVQRVGGDAIADPARVVIEQVGGDDLGVVVRRVREGALAVAIAQRPDARDAGAQLIVDHDVAALVDCDAGLVEAEIVGIRAAADGEQQVRAADSRRSLGAVELGDDLVAALGEADAFGVQADVDAFAPPGSPGSPRRRLRPRAGSGAAPISMIVTSLPKRRNICPNSSPM